MPDLIPDKSSNQFVVVAPLGYKVTAVCGVGHPVAFAHQDTDAKYVPFSVNGQIVCCQCLAPIVGLACNRPHRTFEVEDA